VLVLGFRLGLGFGLFSRKITNRSHIFRESSRKIAPCLNARSKNGQQQDLSHKIKTHKKLSLCWQTRATRLEVSQGHQT